MICIELQMEIYIILYISAEWLCDFYDWTLSTSDLDLNHDVMTILSLPML